MAKSLQQRKKTKVRIAILLLGLSNLILGIALCTGRLDAMQSVGTIVTLIALINIMHYALSKD